MPRAGHPADPDKAGTAGQSARGDLRGFASWPLGCCHAGAPSRRPPSELCARTCPHSRRRTSAVGPRRRASRPDGRSRGHRQPAGRGPVHEGFADAAIDELGRLIDELPAKIKDSVSGGRDAAEALSTDPLQGIAEIVQNADDQLASTVTITWDAETPALLIAHDGTRLHLADLVAMVLPWVSTKRGDNRSTGRFGIGLNTLRTIGDGLHIHCHPYHATLKGGRLTVAAPLMSHLDEEDRPQTVLRIPLAADADLQPDDIRAWLQQWGSAALLFLRSVRTVRLLGPDGDIDVELSLWRRPRRRRRLAVGGTYFKVDITEVVDGSGDGRWLRYEAELPSPAGVTRAKKSTGPTTPVSVAVPTGTTTGAAPCTQACRSYGPRCRGRSTRNSTPIRHAAMSATPGGTGRSCESRSTSGRPSRVTSCAPVPPWAGVPCRSTRRSAARRIPGSRQSCGRRYSRGHGQNWLGSRRSAWGRRPCR